MLYVSISGSTKTGVQPFSEIARMDAMYVLAGTIISSPCLKPNPLIIRFKASSPLAQPIQCLTPINFAKFSSKHEHSFPKMYHPESRTFFILESISSLYLSFIFFKSKNLIICTKFSKYNFCFLNCANKIL